MSKVTVNIPNIVGSRIVSKEDSSNKDIVLSQSSTYTEYPSVKCVYNEIIGLKTEIIQVINDTGRGSL